jgi:hypothetical protein
MSSTLVQNTVLARFPKFELSYETISHKKVSDPYNIALAIPMGKKYYVWFTFQGKKNVCYLMEIMRDKRIGKIVDISVQMDMQLAYGTVLYGTVVSGAPESTQLFVIEDIFFYKGISIKHHTFSEKLGAIENMFSEKSVVSNSSIAFVLPVMWTDNIFDDIHCKQYIDVCGYTVHHVQYRSLCQIVPYINMSAKPKIAQTEKAETLPVNELSFYGIAPTFNYSKPQYKYPTVFMVKADVQFDIYHLFAYGASKSRVYCGLAAIPNYEKSTYMNGLFRNIRENRNLDYIEESDDDEDFEDTRLDKYVDSEKVLLMECTFHKRFKKWVPVRVVQEGCQVVHVGKLV